MNDEERTEYEDVLTLFKLDLGISHTKRDVYFHSLLHAVDKELQEKGIRLDTGNVEDQMLLCDYALWRYRNREQNLPLAMHLRLRIMNRKTKRRAEDVKG